jgi:predicted DsbA family dithiol-disulfide isomerase
MPTSERYDVVMSDDERVQLEVWSDVACPWCFIGRRNLQIALADVEEHLQPDVSWRAFQLDPTIPADGVDAEPYFAAKFPNQDTFDEAHERLQVLGEDVGIQFRFDRRRTIANTHLAQRVIVAARAAELDEQILDALFSANFERGIDIGDPEAIQEVIAEAIGHPELAAKLVTAAREEPTLRALVDREIALARELGITGVPCFVADRRIAVPGAVPPPVLAQLIERAAADRLVSVEQDD